MERQLTYPPLVFAGEARKLKKQPRQSPMATFLLQGGDCRKLRRARRSNIRDFFPSFCRWRSSSLMRAQPVVCGPHRWSVRCRVRRTSSKGDVSLPSYRGDIINGTSSTTVAYARPDLPEWRTASRRRRSTRCAPSRRRLRELENVHGCWASLPTARRQSAMAPWRTGSLRRSSSCARSASVPRAIRAA